MQKSITIILAEDKNVLLKNSLKSKLGLTLQLFFWGIITYCTFLLLLICLQYIPIQYDVAFLATKQSAITSLVYKVAFFTHVFSAIFTIILGAIQFISLSKNKHNKTHRLLGKFYIGIILLLAGPSGLLMSLSANGGLVSQISFFILSLLWMIFTFLAYQYAVQKKFSLHHQWMIRSYALTLSAISLRLLKLGIAHTIYLAPMDSYRIVSWASWIVNLVVAEIIIFYFITKNKSEK
jgi:hypothetical protein